MARPEAKFLTDLKKKFRKAEVIAIKDGEIISMKKAMKILKKSNMAPIVEPGSDPEPEPEKEKKKKKEKDEEKDDNSEKDKKKKSKKKKKK